MKYIYIEEEEEEEEQPGEESKVKIGEVEYTMEELTGLVADGQFKREIETKQNTKIDRVLPEYTKLTQEKSTWEQERDEYLKLKEAHDNANKEQPKWTPEQIDQARKEARELGLFTKEDVEEYVNENFPKFYVRQRTADKTLEKMESLSVEIDGKDGRPKFDVDEMLEYRHKTGIADPLQAYKLKYEAELDKWKETQLLAGKRQGLSTETGSTAGGKQPAPVKITRDNLGKLMREALTEGS